jgi:hypothetical protein
MGISVDLCEYLRTLLATWDLGTEWDGVKMDSFFDDDLAIVGGELLALQRLQFRKSRAMGSTIDQTVPLEATASILRMSTSVDRDCAHHDDRIYRLGLLTIS